MTDTPIAEFSDYQGMLAAIRARATARHLAISSEGTAKVAGLPDRYIQKIIGPKPIRRIGMTSLGPLLGVLGVKLVMVEDEEAIRRFASLIKERFEPNVRDDVLHGVTTRRFLRKIGIKGGKARWKDVASGTRRRLTRRAAKARFAKLSPEQRSEIARTMNRAKWAKKRMAKAQAALPPV